MGRFGIGEVESEPSLHVPVVEEGLRGVPQKRKANRCDEEHRPWLALRKHFFAGVGRSEPLWVNMRPGARLAAAIGSPTNTEQAAQAHGEQVLWHAPCPPCQAE